MRFSRILPTLILMLACVVAECQSPANLKCELRTNPVGIDVLRPRLSWVSTSAQRGWKQTAYRLLVSSSQKLLDKNQGDCWDSGKINIDSCYQIAYSGKLIRSASSYFWKVEVWNNKGLIPQWSRPASFKTGLLNVIDWRGSNWIGYRDLAAALKVVPGVHQGGDEMGDLGLQKTIIPLFRKEFNAEGEIKSATLYITGLGCYEAFVNGKRVGNALFAPGWSNYDKSVFYNTFDVTDLLASEAKNSLGVIVGNGFYNINRQRYRKLVIAYGEPKLIAQLRITFKNGTQKTVGTDSSWKTVPSPVTFTSIYGGEDYDARLEQSGWSLPGFNDRLWQDALLVTPPNGNLVAERDYPVKVKQIFNPKNITTLGDGGYLYDFGQNASGIFELQVRGKRGQEIRLTPAELVTKDHQPNQAATGSPCYFSYILKGGGIETWRPKFSYTGFRYLKVSGAAPYTAHKNSNLPQVSKLTLLHTRNSAPGTGSFSCSNELFNRTFNLINWAIKSNLQSVVTDCPHREKLGWLEQTYLMGSAIHYNFDIYQLYAKCVNDMQESQLSNGLVPDIAPEYVPFADGFRDSPEWGSAAVNLPWLIYKWYGDKSVIEKAWPMMVGYAEYLKSKSDHHILSYGLGDWYDLGPRPPGSSQLTPEALTATASYFNDVSLLSTMALVLNKKDEFTRFSVWASEISDAFNRKFFNPETGVMATGSQTAMAMPWCVGLVSVNDKAKVIQNLKDSIIANGKGLTAGDIGFHFLVEALTRSGNSELLYQMNNRDDVPGYGFQLKKGATALTESWAALESVSNNHLMLGHLMDWFYAGLGGISQTDTSAGYREILIQPNIVNGIDWVKCSYQSPYGQIISNWQKVGKTLKMEVTVPANATAIVCVPFSKGSEIKESGKVVTSIKGIELIKDDNERKLFKVGSGSYRFETVND